MITKIHHFAGINFYETEMTFGSTYRVCLFVFVYVFWPYGGRFFGFGIGVHKLRSDDMLIVCLYNTNFSIPIDT